MLHFYQILYYCSVCLHIFNLKKEYMVDQLDATCKTCIDNLQSEPEIKCNLDSLGKFATEGQVRFDDHLLRKTIEEKIEDAYEVAHENYLDHPILSGALDLNSAAWNDMRRNFILNLRELFVYENEVKEIYEKQKQETLQKIDQKAEDVIKERATQMAEKEIDLERRSQKIEKTTEIVRRKQQEAKNSVESLALGESSTTIWHYSNLVLDAYKRLEAFRGSKKNFFSDSIDYDVASYSLEILRLNTALKKIPDEFSKFEEILLKFNTSLENYQKNKFYFISDL